MKREKRRIMRDRSHALRRRSVPGKGCRFSLRGQRLRSQDFTLPLMNST